MALAFIGLRPSEPKAKGPRPKVFFTHVHVAADSRANNFPID